MITENFARVSQALEPEHFVGYNLTFATSIEENRISKHYCRDTLKMLTALC